MTLLKGMEQKDRVVLSLQNGAEDVFIQSFIFLLRHFKVDSIAVLVDTIGIRLVTVA